MRRSPEDRLIRAIDERRGRDIDTFSKPFKIQYEPRVLSDTERERAPVTNATLLANFLCVHGKAYILRDSRYGCRKCGFYSPNNP